MGNRLEAARPNKTEYKEKQAELYNNLGWLKLKGNDLNAAKQLFQMAREIAEPFSQGHSDNNDFKELLGFIYANEGLLQAKIKNFSAAKFSTDKALSIFTELQQSDPNNPEYKN